MILIKNIEIYAPEYMGIKDVFISGSKICFIENSIEIFNDRIIVIDGSNLKMVPGFIDQHVHITGGGGEGSFKTRVPEITLSKLISAGITTVVGLLGTDGITRSVENLVAKAKALKEEGITVYVLTGSYEYPTITLTGSVKKDIIFIEEVIGAKVALSDHRSASITNDELARLVSDVRVAGMLSGKAGIVVVHMGNGERGLKPIIEVLTTTDIPIRTIRPTHVNRKKSLLMEGFEFIKQGGIIDLTCGIYEKLSPKAVIKMAKESGLPLENITISSDGYGSWSNYDEKGNIVEIGVSQVSSLYNEFIAMVKEFEFDIEEALKFFTSNIAKALNIYPQKGTVKENSDADIILIDDNLKIRTVIAKGKLMIHEGKILVKGTYE
ncbi:isoaspartyl dipeptidase. Metallo peptidase. MEROPS family M38 [Caminicella sporogenes DSM 14501]|uniref:Isoaspartyl dipeptidase n=1 Tax=Caminicella sporogenes DSM 14501 TaxID=1121266 RepID=A0A1M6NX33_9FIRM|nr:beta-aspartyl-peptidase [Caminicella sporogenes]RKD21614.1 beta-aspartyl-peptidase [Caminicella sporogenes]SHK00222.1 isoaspartyl dipeptidase. Metallo peptidase. MEROPS family M38 [Caminicella sporogenes DSM 14501]